MNETFRDAKNTSSLKINVFKIWILNTEHRIQLLRQSEFRVVVRKNEFQ